MKLILIAVLLGLLTTACQNHPERQAVPGEKSATRVVVYAEDEPNGTPMRFCLKGTYGVVLRHDRSNAAPSSVIYELFSEAGGKLVGTQNQGEFRKAIENLPASAKVDFYDTCTFSLSSDEEKNALRYCDEVGKAGACYIMCTDFGAISKPSPWKWKRESGAGSAGK